MACLTLRSGNHERLGPRRRDSSPEEWKVGKSHQKALILLAIGAIMVGILIASFAVLYPYLEENYFGPAPLWHSFDNAFTNSGQLAIESCSVGDLQPVLGGVNGVGKLVATSVVSCSFHGSSYIGLYGYDCNSNPSSVLTVNGTDVSYEGCVLSRAPLNYTFVDIFTIGGTHNVTAIYNSGKSVANITDTGSWKSFGCVMPSNNVTKTTGPLSCLYAGVKYVGFDVTQKCNVVAPVDVGGTPIPSGSCNLERVDVGTA